MTERCLIYGFEQPRSKNPVRLYRTPYYLMGKVTVDSLRRLCGLCASVLNHQRSFPRKTLARKATDRWPAPTYAGR